MAKMNTRTSACAGVLLGGLLLVFAASCSPTGQSPSETKATSQSRPAVGDYYQRPPEKFVANPFCQACHFDFDEEELALNHEIAGIGCERCHGESEKHRSDENNITPPQIMYPKERINPTCMMCHPRHDIAHVAAHKVVLAGAETIFDEEAEATQKPTKHHCTYCHGRHHRMKHRTIRWNKATGEIIPAR